jgi:hypothetical protein
LLKLLTATGMVAIAVAGVRFVEIFGRDIALLHWSLSWVAVPAAILLFYIINSYRSFILRMAGYLTYRTDFVKQIAYLTKIIFSIGTILFVPSIIIFASSAEPVHSAFLYLLYFEAIVWALYLIVQTYDLFAKEKISILHWFLYLCGVEILPVSFLFVVSLHIMAG